MAQAERAATEDERHFQYPFTLGETIHYLYSEWLPQSGEETRDFPGYLQRVDFFPDVPENEAVTDVFLPLREPGGIGDEARALRKGF